MMLAAEEHLGDAEGTTITMEEFAEPNCFTTGAFQQTVRSMTEGP